MSQPVHISQKLEELREAVRLMREAQKAYFKNKSLEDLKASKAHEAPVDRLLEPEVPTNQLSLL